MNAKVMDAVGLIGRYVADNWENMGDSSDLLDELENLGFSSREISDAFRWIERNTLGGDGPARRLDAHRPSMRVLSAVEASRLAPQAQGFLQGLYDRGLIDVVLFEEILERAFKSESEEIGEKEMRRIASLTVFNRVQSEWRDFLHSTNTLVH
jgi:uncharacterized protein Smg (DUF494 family)